MYHSRLYVGIQVVFALVAAALPVALQDCPGSQDVSQDAITKILSDAVLSAVQPGTNAVDAETKVPRAELDDGRSPNGPYHDHDRDHEHDHDHDHDHDHNHDHDHDHDHAIMPQASLGGHSESGGQGLVGNDAVAVANGLSGGGVGSTALNNRTQGSTSAYCSLFVCAASAQSDGKTDTKVAEAHIHATGPLISIKGPLISIKASGTSTNYINTNETTTTSSSS